ncbi:hypothetical protein HK096_002862 [Nowakowskiella sp. JEL0078]|nr:hypothetical protein HK096_002862 [Nowakowskiella sp. JEL0078]
MKISSSVVNSILLRIILPLGLGVLTLGILAVVFNLTQTSNWSNDARKDFYKNQDETLLEKTTFSATLTYNFFLPHILDVKNLAIYSSLVLANGSADLVISRNFFKTQLDGDVPKPSNQAEAALFSSYFNLNMSTLVELNAYSSSQNCSINSTVLDNVLRPLLLGREEDVESVYLGFEDFGLRDYPYRLDNSYKNVSVCSDNLLPPNLVNKTGYIPACRRWYQDAIKAVNKFGFGYVVIGSPYFSTATNAPTITASQAVNGTQQNTVAAIDIKLQKFINTFLKTYTFPGGFTFLMSSNGDLVTYDINRWNKPLFDNKNQSISISSIEFGNDNGKTKNFLSIVLECATNRKVYHNFTGLSAVSSGNSENNERWAIAATPVESTDSFFVVGLMRETELQLEQRTFSDDLQKFVPVSYGLIGTLIILLLLCSIISFLTFNWLAKRITKHVGDLETIVWKISKMERVNLEEIEEINREINDFHENYRNLLVAVEDGNVSLNSGDPLTSLKKYLAAEEMMKFFEENGRGHGVCRCNIGNVQLHLNRILEANESYNFAIDNANQLILNQENIEQKIPLNILLAERLMNLGSLKSLEGDLAKAEELYGEAEKIFRKNHHLAGILQVDGNKGLLLIKKGKVAEASQLINTVYNELTSENSAIARSEQMISLQYAKLNKGILLKAEKKLMEALSLFVDILQNSDTVIRHVQRICIEEAMRLAMSEEINQPKIAYKIFSSSRNIFKGLRLPDSEIPKTLEIILDDRKDLVFLLDTSGGMFGQIIRKCQEFIKKIIGNQMRTNDRVRLEAFSDNTRTVFNWTSFESQNEQETKNRMFSRIDHDTKCGGKSVLFDSLIYTIDSMANSPNASAQWICVLTSGHYDQTQYSMHDIIKRLNVQKQVGVIFVAVGDLINDLNKIEEFRAICDASRGGGLFMTMDVNSESATVDESIQFDVDKIRIHHRLAHQTVT